MGTCSEILCLERLREGPDRLLVRLLQQVALAALELEQAPQVVRVEEQLLLGPLVGHQREGALEQAAGELLDEAEQVERAEWLAQEGLGARARRLLLVRVAAREDDHRDVARLGLALERTAEEEAIDDRHRDVEDDHIGPVRSDAALSLGDAARL